LLLEEKADQDEISMVMVIFRHIQLYKLYIFHEWPRTQRYIF